MCEVQGWLMAVPEGKQLEGASKPTQPWPFARHEYLRRQGKEVPWPDFESTPLGWIKLFLDEVGWVQRTEMSGPIPHDYRSLSYAAATGWLETPSDYRLAIAASGAYYRGWKHGLDPANMEPPNGHC